MYNRDSLPKIYQKTVTDISDELTQNLYIQSQKNEIDIEMKMSVNDHHTYETCVNSTLHIEHLYHVLLTMIKHIMS